MTSSTRPSPSSRGSIEAARRALVGLIRGFGAFLKGAVTVALGLFPGAAEKARRWIDRSVDTAVSGVNKAAAALQDFVAKALDALAAGLDFVLSVYQRAFTLLIDGLKFLAVGLVALLEKIAHLVSAAMQMPDHFVGQVTEELVGQDLTKPLPFELHRAARANRRGGGAGPRRGGLSPADATALTRTVTPDGGVTVDAVAPLELPEELLTSLNLGEHDSVEFGENSDPSRTVSAIQDEAATTAVGGPDQQAAEGAPPITQQASPQTAQPRAADESTPAPAAQAATATAPVAESPGAEIDQTSFTDHDLEKSRTYCYRLAAVNRIGSSRFTEYVCADTLPQE